MIDTVSHTQEWALVPWNKRVRRVKYSVVGSKTKWVDYDTQEDADLGIEAFYRVQCNVKAILDLASRISTLQALIEEDEIYV